GLFLLKLGSSFQTVVARWLELDIFAHDFLKRGAFTDRLNIALRNSASCHVLNITVSHQIEPKADHLRRPNFVAMALGCYNGAHGTRIQGFLIRTIRPRQKVTARHYRWRRGGFSRRILWHRSQLR